MAESNIPVPSAERDCKIHLRADIYSISQCSTIYKFVGSHTHLKYRNTLPWWQPVLRKCEVAKELPGLDAQAHAPCNFLSGQFRQTERVHCSALSWQVFHRNQTSAVTPESPQSKGAGNAQRWAHAYLPHCRQADMLLEAETLLASAALSA